ncbi:MAG TPA: hypothetical protein VHP33_21080 [Polyangiaceae bacterium]|nr:hypothetical protein [Polyangiaceae bacterium]
MIRRCAWTTLMAVGLASATARAEGGTERVSLRYDAPEACPDDAGLVRAVEGYLGQPLTESRAQQLSVLVTVQASAEGFAAKLSFKSSQGTQERFLEHIQCDKLTEGVALLAALAIDPERVKARQSSLEPSSNAERAPAAAEPQPQPQPISSPAPAPAPPPACPKAVQTQVSKPTSQGTLSVAGFLGVGTLPAVAPGVAAEAGWRLRRLRAALVGRYWSSNSADVAGATPRSIELSLATVGLRGCFLPGGGNWTWSACAGADSGSMTGSGEGIDNARIQRALFSSAEASLTLAYTRSDFAPFMGLGASLALTRPRFGVTRGGVPDEAYQPSRFGGLAFVGLTYGL